MFKNVSIAKKITIGFSSVLFLMLVVGGIAFYALTKASNGFTQYREMARDANLAGRLQANMLMVRMNVKDYIITGSDHDIKQYHEYFEEMETFLQEAQREIHNPERAAKIDAVDSETDHYDKAFKEVIEFMKQRNKQVNDVIFIQGPIMVDTLTDIMVSANKDNDTVAAFHTGLALKHLLLSRLYASKFLEKNQQSSVDRVNKEFGKMQERLDILDKELESPNRRRMLSIIVEAKMLYLKAFDEVVKIIFARNKVIKNQLDKLGPAIAKDTEDVKLSIKAV